VSHNDRLALIQARINNGNDIRKFQWGEVEQFRFRVLIMLAWDLGVVGLYFILLLVFYCWAGLIL
jgi:hypothetical protein